MRVLSAVIITLFLASCQGPKDPVVASLGEYEHYAYYTSGGFQDFTDYGKYAYLHADIAENPYLHKVQESDLAELHKLLENFENWIRVIQKGEPTNEVVVNYDFDPTVIDGNDYLYINSEERAWNDGYTGIVSYDIYFFDTQTQILYYFHNNI